LSPHAGRMVSHYRLVGLIGKGGMGEVWKAVDTNLDREVAIKFLPGSVVDDPRRLARFKREAKAAAALNHPNIVTVHSVEESDGAPFITMELVRGSTLAAMIPSGGVQLDRFFDLAIPLADALNESHRNHITHRDLKPSNVMVTTDGRAKIVDFGLALLRDPPPTEVTDAASTESQPALGGPAGTVPYMSPEQIRGEQIDHRSDIFSLGAVLFEMATGYLPSQGDTPADVAASVLREDPTPVTRLNPELPRQLERIINHCLQKEVSKRFQTALDVRNELEELRAELSSGRLQGVSVPSPDDFREAPKSIAVLPFRNLSADQKDEYFCDGITEELINNLGRMAEIKVVSRTSSFGFKDRALPVQEIGVTLGVNSILEGSVRKSNGKVRITVQLVDAADGYQRWSEKYDREFEDVFSIQDEIARGIADVLKVKLVDGGDLLQTKKRTEKLNAYNDFLIGRYYINEQNPEALRLALAHFEKALEEEPDYAPAHSGKADYFVMLGFWGLVRPADAWPRARESALTALEFDDALAEAHVSLGLVHLFFDWDIDLADARFRRALDLNPGSSWTMYAQTLPLTQTGRLTQALEKIAAAEELDPLSPMMSSTHGWVHYYNGDYEMAIASCEKALGMEARYVEARIGLGLALAQTGDADRAIKELKTAREDAPGFPLVPGVLGATLGATGHEDEARKLIAVLDAFQDEAYVPPIAYAMLYSGLGEKDAAFEHLRSALEAKDGLVRYLGVLPIFDPVREEPEFEALLEELQLPNLRKGG